MNGLPAVTEREKLVFAIALGVAICYALLLMMGFQQHIWILNAKGHPVINDFVVFWAVGHLALKGAAIAAYNPHLEHAAELTTIGHSYTQLLGWAYPPLFLALVMLPASLPYVPAFIAWGVVTLVLYASAVAAITKRYTAFVVACALPWVFVELILGQNGFLTAAVIGMALLLLEKRPIFSGLLIGFLSYKPQFGILFPLALAAGGYWRAFGWAALGVLAWNGLAGALFGFDTYGAFLHALSNAAGSHLIRSDLGWTKLQSIYGVLRVFGASNAAAWAVQALVSATAAAAVVLCWHSRNTPFALKAALLAAVIPVATPYILYYDVPILAVAGAFLFRHRQFDKFELELFAGTVPLLFAPCLPPVIAVPSALITSLAVCVITARRLQMLPRPSVNLLYAGL